MTNRSGAASTTEETVTEKIGAFVSAFRYKDLPPVEHERVKLRLLYLLGTVFAARDHEGSKLALDLAERRHSSGPSSFWLSRAKSTAEDCAFVNSILSHVGLLDDMPIHTGAIVIPAALAVAEAEGRTGAETLAALAVGYELVLRLDKPLADGRDLAAAGHRQGFRHSWPAVFGAAVASAYLRLLPAGGIADTLALTTTLCVPGAMAWNATKLGTSASEGLGNAAVSERYIQIAANARQGVFAADLVHSGFRGTPRAFEGDAGLYSIYTGHAEVPTELLQDLGQEWHLDEIDLKAYPGAGYTQPIYCAEKLARKHPVRADQVAKIEVRTRPWGNMPGTTDRGPFRNVEQALASCPFAVAATLVFSEYNWEVIPRALGHPSVDALARRVEMIGQPPEPGSRGGRSFEVTVSLTSGETLVADASDIPDSMTHLSNWGMAVTKFHDLATNLDASVRERIVEEVGHLDERAGVGTLIELLRS